MKTRTDHMRSLGFSSTCRWDVLLRSVDLLARDFATALRDRGLDPIDVGDLSITLKRRWGRWVLEASAGVGAKIDFAEKYLTLTDEQTGAVAKAIGRTFRRRVFDYAGG